MISTIIMSRPIQAFKNKDYISTYEHNIIIKSHFQSRSFSSLDYGFATINCTSRIYTRAESDDILYSRLYRSIVSK